MQNLSGQTLWDSQFLVLVRSVFARIQSELLQNQQSFLGALVPSWINRLSGSSLPEDYYLKPRSAPLLLLPWHLDRALSATPDDAFQCDLMYASINKYYSVRLVDDVMDGHGADPALLPMSSVWDARFQSTYARHFPPDHPFWTYFHETLLRMAVVVTEERRLSNIDLSIFLDFSAAKSCGATIALLAVCYRRDRLEAFPAWLRFWEVFAKWNQMRDDLLDWHRDLRAGLPSYFLCEGQRRKATDESLESWYVREGFAWASQLLAEWTRELVQQAAALGSADVERYVGFRADDHNRQIAEMATGVESLASLSRLEL